MNFLTGVNRLLRIEGILSGDDDNITAFTDDQYSNMVNLAKLAIQYELNDILSDKEVPYEEATGYITLVSSTREYTLASDFVRMSDTDWFLEKVDAATSTGVANGVRIYPWKGGEENLRKNYYQYRTAEGDPNYCYFSGGTSKKLGFFHVPNSNANGDIYRYEYQKNVTVSVETNTIPLINEQAAEAFIAAAGVRFRWLRVDPKERRLLWPDGIDQDRDLQSARALVFEYVRNDNPSTKYGRQYH